jgi:hypothetical protein
MFRPSDPVNCFSEAFLVDTNMLDIFGFSTLKPALNTGSHDGMGRVPEQPEQACGSTDVGCRLKNKDRERLEHQRKAGMLSRPSNGDRFDPAADRLAAGNGRSNFRREPHRIEVSPRAFGRGVGARAGLAALGTAELATSVFKINDDSIGREVEIHVNDFPIVAEPKK